MRQHARERESAEKKKGGGAARRSSVVRWLYGGTGRISTGEKEREVWKLSRVERSNEGEGFLKGEGGVNAERARLFTSLDATRVVSLLTRVV